MKSLQNITYMGICITLAGIVMLLSEKIGVQYAKIIIPILFAIAGVLSILYAKDNKETYKVPSQFSFIQGFGLLIFAIAIAFLPNSLESFLMFMSYFILLFGLVEIMFSFMVLNSNQKIYNKILIYRLISGFLVAIGAVILLIKSFSDAYTGLTIAGVLTILIGLSNIVFASKVKKIVN